MSKRLVLIVGSLFVLATASTVLAKHRERTRDIITFEKMYGVDGPFIGETNAVRNVVGDELPWDIAVGKGSLKDNGHLKIKIRGLVFKNADPVPAEKRGINDEAEFRALVSCLTEAGPNVSTSNVMTTGFPATTSGNADIDATLVLPNPCVAPLVFVLSGSEDKWFSVAGFESE